MRLLYIHIYEYRTTAASFGRYEQLLAAHGSYTDTSDECSWGDFVG